MKIPFLIVPYRAAESISYYFFGVADFIKNMFPFLSLDLKQSESNIKAREYIAICLASNIFVFILLAIFISLLMFFFEVEKFILVGIVISIVITTFVFIDQMLFPKLLASRRIRELERNLLLAFRNIQIELNSGVSLFQSLVSVSKQDYGEFSHEIKKVINDINSGTPAVEALEASALNNPSIYYRRTLWQIVNGMKSGGDIHLVLKETVNSLSREQIIEIENYGSRLSPLAMFYMIIAVILPALSMTMLIVLSSLIAANPVTIKTVFFGLYGIIFFFQLMFMGMIKSRRPNLLG